MIENEEFRCMLFLYLIALTVRENQSVYDLLNVKLGPADNRGEAFYATTGDFQQLIIDTEQGKVPPEFYYKRLKELCND